MGALLKVPSIVPETFLYVGERGVTGWTETQGKAYGVPVTITSHSAAVLGTEAEAAAGTKTVPALAQGTYLPLFLHVRAENLPKGPSSGHLCDRDGSSAAGGSCSRPHLGPGIVI